MEKVRRPVSEWARLIDEWRRSGLSLPAFCQRHGLRRGTMQNWVYKPSFKHALDGARRPTRLARARRRLLSPRPRSCPSGSRR